HLIHLTGTGTCKVTAFQTGDSNWNPAADVTQKFKVTAAPVTPTTTVLTGPSTATPGQSITITATVSSSTGGPTTGTVRFETTLGTVLDEVPISSGTASTTFNAPSANTTLKLKAIYVPSAGGSWKGSTSAKLVIKVHS